VDEPLGEVEVEPVVGVEKLPTAVVQPGAFFLGDCLAWFDDWPCRVQRLV